MAPDSTHVQYKKRTASNRRRLDSVSPVDSLAPSLSESAPQPAVADGSKKGKPPSSKSKSRKTLTKSRHPPTHPNSAVAMSDIDDKKRNKLGYQRISIACAHCRRRKIRCLVAEGDPQNRCQNCIRLKKECLFYPVDQQGAMETRPDGKTKSGHGSTQTPSVTMSPSQDSINGRVEPSSYHVYSDYHGIPITPGAPYLQNDYPMHTQGPPTPWSPTAECPPQAQAIPATPTFMGYPNVNMSPEYASFPGVLDPDHPGVPRVASMGGYGTDGDRSSWSAHPPARSMSYPEYPGDGMYGSRYPPDLQHPAGAFSQAPMQLPVQPASMNGYAPPLNYALVHDQNGGGMSGVPMHPTLSASWAASGPLSPGREEKSRSLIGPQ